MTGAGRALASALDRPVLATAGLGSAVAAPPPGLGPPCRFATKRRPALALLQGVPGTGKLRGNLAQSSGFDGSSPRLVRDGYGNVRHILGRGAPRCIR